MFYTCDSSAGQFIVLPGGAGLYFIYFNFLSDYQNWVNIYVQVNGVELCVAHNDEDSSGVNDRGSSSHGAVVILAEGTLLSQKALVCIFKLVSLFLSLSVCLSVSFSLSLSNEQMNERKILKLFSGDVVDVYYHNGSDETPVNITDRPFTTFTGFRIAPE